jgi:hypothetical protein
MILLSSVSPVEAYAAFVSTACAVLTVIYMVKTKSLSDVVKSLQDANQLATQAHALNITLADPKIYPSFILKDFTPGDGSTGLVTFFNKGEYATAFQVADCNGDISRAEIQNYHDIINTKKLNVVLKSSIGGLANFSLLLKYKDGYGKEMQQSVSCVNGNITMEPNKINQ